MKKKPPAPRPMLRSTQNINWCEKFLLVPEGKEAGQPMRLPDYMKEDFRKIYDNPYGTRRAIITRGRKNAKTCESAEMLLLHLCGPEARRNSQLFSAAQSREQASLLFSYAAKMVRMSKPLSRFVAVKESTKQLVCEELGTRYRALSAEATTAYGLNPSFVVHDELGQVRGPRQALYDALESATGAQANPLSIIISTQASSDDDLLSQLIDDALAGHDPRVVLRMDSAPLDIDPFSETAIRAANPAFDYFMNKAEVLAMAADSRRLPAKEATFRNLVLNQRIESYNPFISVPLWKACGDAPKDLQGATVYGGLDLSSVSDLTALVLIGKVEGIWQIHPFFWLPEEGIREKSLQDHVPYDLWADQGYLRLTPGNTVGYEFVAKELREIFDQLNIVKIAFDRWNIKHLVPWLKLAGFNDKEIEQRFEPFGQGTQSMSPALRELEQTILDRKLAHGNHPVLTMCAACAIVEGKDDANRKLSKNRSTGRIDGMVSLAMAFGVAPMQANSIDISSLIG